MKKENCITYSFFFILPFAIQSIYAQTAHVPAQPAATESSDKRLHMANPFYLPYAREWQLTLAVAALQQRVRTDIPSQTFVGLPLATTYSETNTSTYVPSLSVKYGIVDRFSLGVSADTFVPAKTETTRGAWNSTTFASGTAPNGFAGGEVAAYGRLAGTRPGQIYLDLAAIFRPGLLSSDVNATNVGRMRIAGGIATGINFRWITAGVAGVITYAPTAKVTSSKSSGGTTTSVTTASAPSATVAAGQFVLQCEWTYVYGRGIVGYSKQIDSSAATDPVNKYASLTYGVAGGIKITERTLLEVSWSYTPEIRGDDYYTGYASAMRQYVTVGPTTQYGLAFSLKL